MTTVDNKLGDALLTAEGGGWLMLRRRAPGLRELSAVELLHRTAQAPGNVRYAIDDEGPYVIEEVRTGDGLTLGAAEELFFGLDNRGSEEVEPATEEAIEAALDGSGCPWSRRASSWVVVVTERQPREVLVSVAPGGARVTTILADWDEIAPACAETLAQFLVAAQAGLRFARCQMNARQANVVAFAAVHSLDTDLPHAQLGVAAGCELLAREATALLRPELAEMYRNSRRIPSRKSR